MLQVAATGIVEEEEEEESAALACIDRGPYMS
jgi:hypothetical protein